MKKCARAAIVLCAVANIDAGATVSIGDSTEAEEHRESGHRRVSLRHGHLEISSEEKPARRRPAVPHDEEVERPWAVQRQVERIMLRVSRLDNATGTQDTTVAEELERLEAQLATASRERGDANAETLQDEIRAVRASLCAEPSLAHDKTIDCVSFMRSVCPRNAGGALATAIFVKPESLARRLSTANAKNAACQKFFLEQSVPSEESDKSDSKAAADEGQGKAAREDSKGKESEKSAGSKVYEPVGAAPAPAAAPGKVLFGSKKERPLPVHGYNEFGNGTLVEHDDNKTVTEDWGKEFGEPAGHEQVPEICKDYPDNEWCKLHMNYYYSEASHRSAGSRIHDFGSAKAIGIGAVMALFWMLQLSTL